MKKILLIAALSLFFFEVLGITMSYGGGYGGAAATIIASNSKNLGAVNERVAFFSITVCSLIIPTIGIILISFKNQLKTRLWMADSESYRRLFVFYIVVLSSSIMSGLVGVVAGFFAGTFMGLLLGVIMGMVMGGYATKHADMFDDCKFIGAFVGGFMSFFIGGLAGKQQYGMAICYFIFIIIVMIISFFFANYQFKYNQLRERNKG